MGLQDAMTDPRYSMRFPRNVAEYMNLTDADRLRDDRVIALTPVEKARDLPRAKKKPHPRQTFSAGVTSMTARRKSPIRFRERGLDVAPRPGLEPGTYGLTGKARNELDVPVPESLKGISVASLNPPGHAFAVVGLELQHEGGALELLAAVEHVPLE